ncbi:MAG: reverse gyrase [Candidatus Aenigmatarchaeota archaeon]
MLLYENACPNCNGRISYERLEKALPCEKCLPNEFLEELNKIKPGTKKFYEKLRKLLAKNYTLKNYNRFVKLLKVTNNFLNFFKKAIGSKAWSAQRMWAIRILKNQSFAILAPTGTGKTTFLIIASLFLAQKFKKKIYFILPTSLLASQVKQKFDNILAKLNLNVNVIAYHSLLKQKEKEEAMQKILNKEYQILITTNMFLSKKFDLIKDENFDIIFVDDVDSFLKASKNIDKVLKLLGFKEEVIQKALENVELRRNLVFVNEEKRKEIEKKIEENEKFIKANSPINKILIVSGASARARVKRVMLFKELLNFQIGTRIEGIRNVVDTYEFVENIEEKVYAYVKKFGKGGLIFVPMDKGIEYAKKLEEYLVAKGINAKALEKTKLSIINDFILGNIDVLIGVASYRSPLARGIDLPEVIRYAIFAGVPKFKIKIDLSEFKAGRLIMLLLHLREYLDKKEDKDKLDVLVNKLRKITGLTEENLKIVIEAIKEDKQLEGFLEYCRQVLKDSYEFLKNLLSNKDFVEKLKQSKKLTFGEEDKFYFVIADVQAYIQASGRTSRLYAGGISKGLSLVLIDEEKAFNSLKEKIKWFDEKAEFKEIKEIDLEKVLKEIDKDREKIKAIKEGKIEAKRKKELVKIGLMIVESPTKAKTIARFFGIPAIRDINDVRVYEVSSGDYILLITASIGHVYDLVTKDGFHGILVKDNSFIPIYGTIKVCPKCNTQYTDLIDKCPKDNEKLLDKINILNVLRELAIEADEILIATDPDAEGEKIGFDIASFIKPYNQKIKRLEFHEITYRAIRNALDNPREINLNLVKAQIVRRIEDRWFGFELSQKVQMKFGKKKLSAGRVQTPVLGWIIQRTLESKNSVRSYIRIKFDGILTIFDLGKKLSKEEKDELLAKLVENPKVIVKVVERKEEILNPLPPYTTDSLLKDSANLLKFDSAKTMRLAQDLFESGLITYHRTDSTSVSSFGINLAKQYISENFGEEFFVARSWQKEGAHECIRPTRPIDSERLVELIRLKLLQIPIRLTRDHVLLYDLIFRRFIASQMKPAKVEKTTFKFILANYEKTEEQITKIIEEGFIKISKIKVSEIREGEYAITFFDPDKSIFTKPAIPLYTQGDVIALMKERGIGRPSTYATIITKILDRRYALSKNNKIFATKRGMQVYEFLKTYFEKYISEEVTRDLEKKMDLIEENKADYLEILREIYKETIEIKNSQI